MSYLSEFFKTNSSCNFDPLFYAAIYCKSQDPQSDERWGNFLRLIKIMLLSISPSVTRETASIIELMISIHHTKFRHLYPKAAVTPKMHFMVHLPSQMRLYGPQRSAWCMRFEAKHSTFKGRKWRNFQNLPFSVASFHQKLMCAQQMSGL